MLPPSSDIEVVKPLLESLDPAIMPLPGSNAAAALPLALRLLGEDAAIGTVLFVNDGFDPADVPGALPAEAVSSRWPGLRTLRSGLRRRPIR